MKRLILADIRSQNSNGHTIGHYRYLAELYIKLFCERCEVKIAGGPVYKEEFNKSFYFPLPYDSYDNENVIKRYYRTLKNFKSLIRNTTSNDVIVMQFSSVATYIIALALHLGKIKRNIYAIIYDTDALSNWFKRFMYSLAKRQLKGLITSNKEIGEIYGLTYCVVPDYIFCGNIDSLYKSTYAEKIYDFALLGNFYPDKGVVEAVNYMANKPYKLIVAGKPFDKEMSNFLDSICSKCSNIEYHGGFVSDEDYLKFINSSRYCMLNYQGMYMSRSSGVVLDSMFNGVPVVGHESFPLKIAIEENVGYVYHDIHEFDPSKVLNEEIWNYYRNNIKKYLKENNASKERLASFLKLK